MDDLDPTACFLADSDDLLNFSLEDEEEKDCNQTAAAAGVGRGGPSPILSSSMETSKTVSPYDFPEPMEEELEWISNKDAFPGVETCFGIFVDNPLFDQKSPVSVLENSSSNSTGNAKKTANAMISVHLPVSFPRRQRSKDMRRPRRTGFGELPTKNCLWVNSVKGRNNKPDSPFLMLPTMVGGAAAIGRRCQHCGVDKTPQWRAGPMGPKTLCNACGVRFKSGRLLPEYRPANSPTFSAVLHSNSHRKVLEMRRHKEACG